jgi:hypothetical protein
MTSRFASLSVALALVACGGEATRTADNDLSNDLKLAANASLELANQQASARYAATEIAPKANPEPGRRLVRSPGPNAVPAPEPTVAAEPEPTTATVTEVPQVQIVEVVHTAAATIDEVPAVPRPVPTSGGYGDFEVGTGVGTVRGGTGVVIRGGGVGGDGDRCEIHMGGGRRPGFPGSIGAGPRGVYVPNTGGAIMNRPVPSPTPTIVRGAAPRTPVVGNRPRGGR